MEGNSEYVVKLLWTAEEGSSSSLGVVEELRTPYRKKIFCSENLNSSRPLSKKLKVNTYKTIILPVVLYGCETWSLKLKEELRLRAFENKVGPT